MTEEQIELKRKRIRERYYKYKEEKKRKPISELSSRELKDKRNNDNMFKSPRRPSNPNSTPPRMSTRRSPARSSKSPARTSKSPARTSKSPTRTSKSPARTSKSPGRISKKSSKEDITSSSSNSQTTKMELTPSTKKKSTRSPTRKANSVAEPVVSVKKVSVTSKPLGTTVSRTTVLETKKSVRSFETADEPHVSATKDSKTYITGREQRPLLSEDFKLSFLGRQPHLLVPSREHTWRKPTIISTHEDSTEMTYTFSGNSGSSLSTETPLKSAGSRDRFSQQREDSPFVSIARRSIRGDSPFLVADRGSTRSDSPSVSTAGKSVREDSPAVTLLRRETRDSVLREFKLNSHSTPIREITPLPTQIYSPKFKLYDYKPIVEFGGWFGALAFMFILPLSVLALHLHCNKCYLDRAASRTGKLEFVTGELCSLIGTSHSPHKVSSLPNFISSSCCCQLNVHHVLLTVQVTYSSPMSSLGLTDSFEKLPDQITYPYTEPYDLQKHVFSSSHF
uniref:Uncharacterized protein n=1 Tax=Timema cristinae TaxID=61476 RepID=A0A7R9H2R8_TIMCR|nr:unnamed protein product [Timema cristinae]